MSKYDDVAEQVNAALREAQKVKTASEREASNAYDKAITESHVAHAEAIRPIRTEYEKTTRTLREEYDKATSEFGAVQTASDKAANETYDAAIKTAAEVYVAAAHTAATEAAKDSDLNPAQVRALAWMIQDGVWSNYHSYCLIALRALPVTLEGLTQLQARENWCGEFNTILDRALAAGAIEGVTEKDASEYRMSAWLRRNISYTSTQNELRAIVDQVVAARLAEINAAPADEVKDEELVKADA